MIRPVRNIITRRFCEALKEVVNCFDGTFNSVSKRSNVVPFSESRCRKRQDSTPRKIPQLRDFSLVSEFLFT